MPFSISGNVQNISPTAIRNFSKSYGVILSKEQDPRQQYVLIQKALRTGNRFITDLLGLRRDELLSLVFLLTQFGDVQSDLVPPDYLNYQNIPFILEWSKGNFMIPLEVIEFISTEKIFKDQNYLFSLLPTLPLKEKKAWTKWMEVDYDGDSEWDLNHTIYRKSRDLQIPFKGKSFLHEDEFYLEQIWKPGSNSVVNWFYKGLTPFYYTMQELHRTEKDPFLKHVLDIIRAGKYILRKEPERFKEKTRYKLVKTIEGCTEQIRKVRYYWEYEAEVKKNSLFYYNSMGNVKVENSLNFD